MQLALHIKQFPFHSIRLIYIIEVHSIMSRNTTFHNTSNTICDTRVLSYTVPAVTLYTLNASLSLDPFTETHILTQTQTPQVEQ